MGLEKNDVRKMAEEIRHEDSLFLDKTQLDTLIYPSKVIGRDEKVHDILRILLQYEKGHVVPFISIFGRSGSGKSTTVRIVCQSLDDEDGDHKDGEIKYKFVNLRQAKTLFGCANLILSEFGQPQLQSAKGVNSAIAKISGSILDTMAKGGQKDKEEKNQSKKQLFILVLDEFDALFLDKRNDVSDFIFKLLDMVENLRQHHGCLATIIAISNNVMADYSEIDDRVKSRIGSTAVHFEPYSEFEIQKILRERARNALSADIDDVTMYYCADKSSLEHGDARRALDLLRVAAEIAESRHEKKITTNHIDAASSKLQEDRISTTLASASYHLKLVSFALARMTYLTGKTWHSTSNLYDQYRKVEHVGVKLLEYRRVSELLTDLANTGIAESKKSLNGRYGNGNQFRLTCPPELVGKACFAKLWNDHVAPKLGHIEDNDDNVFGEVD